VCSQSNAGASKGGEYASAGAGFEALLDGAKQSHFNMLRVWGGGIFERDDFYDIADELGIMVRRLLDAPESLARAIPRNTPTSIVLL